MPSDTPFNIGPPEPPRRPQIPKIGGGYLVDAQRLPDGVELRVKFKGCQNPTCMGCGGWVIEVLTKIEPNNYNIAAGDVVYWPNRETLYWISRAVGERAVAEGRQVRGTPIRRLGIYKRISATRGVRR